MRNCGWHVATTNQQEAFKMSAIAMLFLSFLAIAAVCVAVAMAPFVIQWATRKAIEAFKATRTTTNTENA